MDERYDVRSNLLSSRVNNRGFFSLYGGGVLKPSTYRFVVDGVILTSKRDLELFIEVGFKYIVLGAFSFHPQFNLVRPIHGSPILITMGPIDIVK